MWWRDAVIYQIYVRSFADSNGDGHGDLPGIRSKLDYLEWLGVDAVWLTPVHPSPNADWGYDVSNYRDIHPDYGTLEDLDALVDDAKRRGIKVLIDLVPNHTSSEHPWFKDRAKRDWYVWADEPNNWESTFGGPAWTKRPDVGRYYLHNFLPEQPDLDWWNPEVRAAFEEILAFWFDRGVAGFRIDVAHALVKDKELRDNPFVGKAKDRREERIYNMNRPEVHDVYRRWREIARGYDPERVLLGETWVAEPKELVKYYGDDDELQLGMYFPFTQADFDAAHLRPIVERWERILPPTAWPSWCGSNHDLPRFPTRWCAGDEAKIRCALTILLTLRGTPLLYYGDEVGMEQVEIPENEQLDRAHSRDGCRTPMPWTREPDGEWWLRWGDTTRNVEDMRADPTSILHLCRDLIALRRELHGPYAPIDGPDGVWAWRRGDSALVAVNLSDRPHVVRGIGGSVGRDTSGARTGEAVEGELRLEPWEGVVLLTGT
jgi:alpha-glucosidase